TCSSKISKCAVASAKVFPASALFKTSRRRSTSSASMTESSSTLRCSTRPLSVITTTSKRTGDNATTSQCLTVDTRRFGICTTAAESVICASIRAARCNTSCKSTPPSKKASIALRSGRDKGLRSCSESTKTRRSEEHTSELQSRFDLVCRLLLEKKKEK